MSKAIYEKIKNHWYRQAPLKLLDDDELLDCADKAKRAEKQENPKQHSTPRIRRSVWFTAKSHPEKQYRELIMLFTSWRNERNEKNDFKSF